MTGPSTRGTPGRQLLGDCRSPWIIETHPVYQGFVSNGTKHPGWLIPWLRMPGHAAQFGETKTQNGPRGHGRGMLVHARSEADGLGNERPNNSTGKFGAAKNELRTSLQNSAG
jgi:hypothetical protein